MLGMGTQLDDTTRTGRVAIVTGGSLGIGREVTLTLARRSYVVVIHYARNQSAADATVEEILAANGTALTVRGDVTDELDVERLFTETTEAFGGVDVVVHAVPQIILSPVVDADLDRFDELLRTTARGTFVVNRQAARDLRQGGAIVNLSSSGVGLPLPTYAAHVASTAAVNAITRVLARELHERDITVNAVASQPHRPGRPPDIANLVAFLVSQDGHAVNGQVIQADSRRKAAGRRDLYSATAVRNNSVVSG